MPGTYLIRATEGTRAAQVRAQREVRVGGSDVEGVTLDMAPGVEVRAVVQSPETQAGPQADRLPPPAPDSIELSEVDDEDGPGPLLGEPDTDGSIVISNVPQGQYRLRISSSGSYPASAVAGGQDLLRGGLLVVAPGVAPPTIEIVMRNDFGTVTGTVAGEMAATPNLWALLAPVRAGVEPLTTSLQNGRFEFKNVAPGDYQAYLLNGLDTLEYANPYVLSALRGGERVRVAAGERSEVVLKELAQ